MSPTTPEITIVAGSDSDIPKISAGIEFLKKMAIPYVLRIASAHRAPELVTEIAKDPSVKVFIAVAGMNAALPGCIAANTTRPVLAVPISSQYGLPDSLFATTMMPPGIPVLSLGIDASLNAAIGALEILALSNKEIEQKLLQHRQEMRDKVYEKDKKAQANSNQ